MRGSALCACCHRCLSTAFPYPWAGPGLPPSSRAVFVLCERFPCDIGRFPHIGKKFSHVLWPVAERPRSLRGAGEPGRGPQLARGSFLWGSDRRGRPPSAAAWPQVLRVIMITGRGALAGPGCVTQAPAPVSSRPWGLWKRSCMGPARWRLCGGGAGRHLPSSPARTQPPPLL